MKTPGGFLVTSVVLLLVIGGIGVLFFIGCTGWKALNKYEREKHENLISRRKINLQI